MNDFSVNTSLREHQQACLTILSEFDRVCNELDIPYYLFAGTLLGCVRHQGFIPWDDDLDVLMLRKDYDRFIAQADMILNKEKFYLQKEFSEHWPMFFSKLRLNNTTCLEMYHARDPEEHHGIYIDIFPCDNAARSNWQRKIQFFSSKVVIAKSLKKRGYQTNSKKKKLFMAICSLLPQKVFMRMTTNGNDDSEYIHTFFGSAHSFSKNVYPRKLIAKSIDAKFENQEYPIPIGYDEMLTTIYGDYTIMPPEEERSQKKHAVLVDLNNSYEHYHEVHKNMIFENITKSIR